MGAGAAAVERRLLRESRLSEGVKVRYPDLDSMHWNGDDMYTMRKLGWISLLAAAVAMSGCDDGGSGDSTGVGTSASVGSTETEGNDSTGSTTDPTGEEESSGGAEGSSGGSVDCDSAPSHATNIQPIWDANCVEGCHEPGGTWPNTDLTDGMAYDMLVEADGIQTMALSDYQLVIPGDPDHSYLLNKLEGTQEDVAGIAGGLQMPQEADPLSATDIALVEQWIACGAEP